MPKKKILIDTSNGVSKLTNTKQTHEEKRWIIYLRVSTDQQKKDWHGIENQEANCRKWAKEHWVEIVAVFKDEGISWNSITDRKDFIKAISFLKEQNNKFTTIQYFICDSTSRFSRNHKIEKTYELVWEVQATGAELVAVSYWGVVDMESEMGIMKSWFSFLIDSLESKRGQTRVMNGMKWRMLNGYRTFAQPPLGYQFQAVKALDKTNKILVTKEPDATIITEWLTMFADGKLITKQELYSFFQEKKLASNSKYNKTGRLHLSIIDRLLDPWKLLVYAGYLTYPDRGITDIIPAKHKALISMNDMERILIRLWKYKNVTNMKTVEYGENANDYPLRWVLYCPVCDKKMTWWASKSHTKDLHYYYWCNNKNCSIYKKTLRREELHNEMKDLIEEITPPREIATLAEKIFNSIWKDKRDLREKNMSSDKERIKEVEKHMETLMDKILTITNPTVEREAQKRYEALNEEKNQLLEKLEYDPLWEMEKLNLLNDVKTILINPVTLWNKWDHNMKKLLINVLFNGKVYYTKNQGYQTPDLTALHKLFQALKGNKCSNGGP